MDVNDIKNFNVDLIPLPKDDDGYLGEVDDCTRIKPLFEVTYSNLDENNGTTNGKLRIKSTTSISDLKALSEGFRTAVFDVKIRMFLGKKQQILNIILMDMDSVLESLKIKNVGFLIDKLLLH